jgi:hypothetical protein
LASLPLFLPLDLFVGQSAAASPGAGLGLFTHHYRLECFEDQASEEVSACLEITRLLAVHLAMDLEQPLVGDP